MEEAVQETGELYGAVDTPRGLDRTPKAETVSEEDILQDKRLLTPNEWVMLDKGGLNIPSDKDTPGDEVAEESDTVKKNSDEILKETLSSYITDQDRIKEIMDHVPCNRTELDPATVFKVLVGTMSYRWFDLFKAVGMSYDALVEIKERFPYDAEISLFEAITEWLKGEGPKPSWKSLADTLSYEMLESKLANEITEKHFSEDDYAEAELLRKDGIPKPLVKEQPPPAYEDGSTEFSKLILEIIDLIGQNSYAEFYYYLKELQCPDGTKFFDESYFYDHRSPDSILIPLLYNNVIVSRDLDVLIAVIRGLGRDDILQTLKDYSSKINIGFPTFQGIQDTERFFSLDIQLDPSIADLDLEAVCYIKQDMCEALGVEKVPYLLQFLGWMKNPVVAVRFQTHFSLIDRVIEMVHDESKNLENYTRIEVNVRGTVFDYDLKKLRNIRALEAINC